VSTLNGRGHRGNEDGTGAPPERWQGCWGAGRGDTASEPKSLGGDDEEEDEDREEGEVTPPPHSLLPEDLPSLSDIFSRQARISFGTGWPKRS
jgi:hypothetical protein